MSAINENSLSGIEVTDAHYHRLESAMAGDVCRLTPEMIGEEATALGALLLAVMDQLNERTGLCGHIVLSLVQENLWAHAYDWSRATFDLVDSADLRAIRRYDEEIRAMRSRRGAYSEKVQAELASRAVA